MPDNAKPQRPTGLSGQEEEELRTLEKGYDPQAGALPDQELPVHDDRDRKPGDGPVTRPQQESRTGSGFKNPRPETEARASRADSDSANPGRERDSMNPAATDPSYEGAASISPGPRNPSR
jgi:hypothetical protein